MKHILIPVDFSEAAENALNYALNFAKPFDAEIICFHANNGAITQTEAYSKLQKFIAVNSLTVAAGLRIKTVVIDNSLEKAIKEYLSTEHIDIIIMGTKGAHGFQKMLSGSNTTDLLSSTSLPFLVVPEDFTFKGIHYLLLASDFNKPVSTKAFSAVADTARAFDAEVRIAHVKTSDKISSDVGNIEAGRELYIMADQGVKHSLKKIKWTDIIGGINYYLGLKGDNDMLVLMRQSHGFMDRIFRHDHTYEFACNPTLPLLIIHES